MTSDKTKIVAEPGRQEILVSRRFDAPADLVFRAHVDPTLFARWYGCRGMKTDIAEFDARRGGAFRYSQSVDGRNPVSSWGVFHDVVSGKCIVRTVEMDVTRGRVSLETARFESLGDDTTRVSTQTLFQSTSDRDAMLESGVEHGARETFLRLEELLSEFKPMKR